MGIAATVQHTPEYDDAAQRNVQDVTAGVLADITAPSINLAIWQRQLIPEVAQDVRQLLTAPHWQDLRVSLPTDNLRQELNRHWPAHAHYPALRNDVTLLAEMLACLFQADWIAVRLARLEHAMCPRFHTDKVPCRLITTYAGQGTEWLPHQVKSQARATETRRPDYQAYAKPGDIQALQSGEVALFKGDDWPGQEGSGVVHRSPGLAPGQRRLVLTLDFA